MEFVRNAGKNLGWPRTVFAVPAPLLCLWIGHTVEIVGKGRNFILTK